MSEMVPVGRFTRRSLLASAAMAAAPRDILTRSVTAQKLDKALLPREQWHPYPKCGDRAGWEKLPSATRAALVTAGEDALKTAWAVLPATVFLEFKRNGNRSHYEAIRNVRRDKLRNLVMAECAEGKGRFLDEIVNGVWLTCEESWWGLPAHMGAQKAGVGLPDVTQATIDLFEAETSMLMSWIWYLLAPELGKVSPLIPERIYRELDRRVLAPAMARNDWGWMGLDAQGKPTTHSLNNWTPWICSNWLATALLVDRDESRRRAAVLKILRINDNWLNQYDDDGGCDEGPGYWNAAGGALFDNLELLYLASNGGLDFYSNPLVKEIGRYVYRAHIAGDYYTNFADASAVVHIDSNMVWRYGNRIGDPKMAELGAWAGRRHDATTAGSIGRQLPRLFSLEQMRSAPANETMVRDVWLPGIQVMAARVKEGSAEGLYVATHGGHNAESHNHNDVGDFIVYAGGKPVIIDVGVETYSAKTFSAKRYDIWTMQSQFHNLPTIDGKMQEAGRQYAAREVAYRATDAGATLEMDIAGAWAATAGISSWKRAVHLDRGKSAVEVRDRYTLAKAPGEITLTLMTPCKMREVSAGVIALAPQDGPEVKVTFDATVFRAVQEEIPIPDPRLRSSWGPRLYRILLHAANPGAVGDWVLRFSV